MKRIAIVTTVASMIELFCKDDIEYYLEYGEVHLYANFEEGNSISTERMDQFIKWIDEKGVQYTHVAFSRNPFSKDNYLAYKFLKKELLSYDFLHLHTPISSAIVRLAVKGKVKTLYTAHGFHFHSGSSLINWLIFYPIEKYLARYTDAIIVLNKEDAKRARKMGYPSVFKINGVGIDECKLKRQLEAEPIDLGIKEEDPFILASAGELNNNKNHEVVIRAMGLLQKDNIHYVICGKGPLENKLKELSQQLGIEKNVHLLGFRDDVAKVVSHADVFIMPSYREGLPMALMEAMALGKAVIASSVRGNVDLVENGKNGLLFEPNDVQKLSEYIDLLYRKSQLRLEMGIANQLKSQSLTLEKINDEKEEIYVRLLNM